MLQVIAAAVLALLLSPGDAPAQTAPHGPAPEPPLHTRPSLSVVVRFPEWKTAA